MLDSDLRIACRMDNENACHFKHFIIGPAPKDWIRTHEKISLVTTKRKKGWAFLKTFAGAKPSLIWEMHF